MYEPNRTTPGPENTFTQRWLNAGNRLRPSIEPTSGERLMFAGISVLFTLLIIHSNSQLKVKNNVLI